MRLKLFYISFSFFYLLFFSLKVSAQHTPANPGAPWPATDALGRPLPAYAEVGPARENKFVGLFYWTWHMNFVTNPPYNATEILAKTPEALYNYQHPAWPPPKRDRYFFWGEPLFGYYRNTDTWVLRKHAEMLADAGVDVLFFDCTNGHLTWKESYQALCRVFEQARQEGVRVPKIAFMLAFGPSTGSHQAIRELYQDLYQPCLYPELWFYWHGKPLIMAYPETLGEVAGDAEATRLNREIRDFFTFRPGQPLYNQGPQRPDHWGWLQIFPQHGFGRTASGGVEQVPVGVAQNWSRDRGLTAMNAPGAFGRSYTHEQGQINTPGAVNFGYNFQEQWDRALSLDPEFIFVTGWNEWVAGRYPTWGGQENAFPDQFSQEHSRDLEPMRGGHGDNYYYQLISNIRRFKGMPPEPVASPARRIKIDGRFTEWVEVRPEYRAYRGNTRHRDSPGWQGTHYKNNSGRNDIVLSRVARDRKYVYFYVQTAAALSPASDKAWMRLFIDTDRNKQTGWAGFDLVVNRLNPGRKAVLEKSRDGWQWEATGQVDYAVRGNELELRIPRALLGNRKALDLEFKWSDNMQQEGEVMDFWLHGDVAPAGRFNYRYQEK